MKCVYSHPDGFTLAFNDHTLIATDDDGKTVCLPIGPLGLLELAAELVALANDGRNLAEHAEATLGHDLVQELFALRGQSQALAFQTIHDKLHALSKLEHADRAAGGFAVAVVNVLEVGIANLPKFEEVQP